MAAVVGVVSRCGLIIEVSHRNEPNKSKFTQYIPLFSQLYINNKMEHFNYKGGCDMAMCIKAFKRRAGWAIDQCLQVINSYTTKALRNM